MVCAHRPLFRRILSTADGPGSATVTVLDSTGAVLGGMRGEPGRYYPLVYSVGEVTTNEVCSIVNVAASTGESPSVSIGQDSFLPLLVALIATLLLAPLAKPLPLLVTFVGMLAQMAGLYAVWHARSIRTTAIGGLAICVPMRLAAHLFAARYPWLILLSHISTGAYFVILIVVVLIRVITQQRVTSQTVIGAICGYLLLGYVFTFGYLSLTFLDPGAIAVDGHPLGLERVSNIGEHTGELMYFSFISLTTVGYGDIVPVCPAARTLAVVEVLTGQLYLAAFVARLVGAMSNPSSNQPPP